MVRSDISKTSRFAFKRAKELLANGLGWKYVKLMKKQKGTPITTPTTPMKTKPGWPIRIAEIRICKSGIYKIPQRIDTRKRKIRNGVTPAVNEPSTKPLKT